MTHAIALVAGEKVCFQSPYETMDNPGDMLTEDFNGKTCTVLNLVDPDTYDAFEVGPMFRVKFDDGTEATCWPEELHRP